MEVIAVPEWVPAPVTRAADLIANSFSDAPPGVMDLVCRLVIDERMKGVWQDLQKHKREDYLRTTSQFYQTELPETVRSWKAMATAWRKRATEYREFGDEATARQYENFASSAAASEEATSTEALSASDQHELVLALVFALAVGLYCAGLQMVRRSDLQQQVESLRAVGRSEAASSLERHSQMPNNHRFLVARKRGDLRINAFVEGMAKELRLIFGQDMPGVIATITNVAFQKSEYDRDRVRALLKIRQ